jgi:hypothetical protein
VAALHLPTLATTMTARSGYGDGEEYGQWIPAQVGRYAECWYRLQRCSITL